MHATFKAAFVDARPLRSSRIIIFWTDDIMIWTPAVLSIEQFCLEVCFGQCKSSSYS